MEDMIQIQNFVTRPISRLDLIMSNLMNESEESLSYNSTDWTQNHAIFETEIQFQQTH